MIKTLLSLLAFGIGSVLVYDSLIVGSLIDDIFEKQILIIEDRIEYPTEIASSEEFEEFENEPELKILKATRSLNSHIALTRGAGTMPKFIMGFLLIAGGIFLAFSTGRKTAPD